MATMSDLDDGKRVTKDSPSLPVPVYGLTVEHDEGPDRERDIIAIHGIKGAAKDTWSVLEEPGTCWLLKFYPKSRIISYNYDTSCENGTCFNEASIAADSLKLLKNLADLRDREPREQQKPLLFVSHDVGGAIAKSVLIHAARDLGQYEHIFLSVRALIFFGYPHSPLSATILQEKLSAVILQNREAPVKWGSITRSTTSLSHALIAINQRFYDTKVWLQAYFVNVYTDTVTRVRSSRLASALQDTKHGCLQIFSRDESAIRVPYERLVAVTTDHDLMTRLDYHQVETMTKIRNENWQALELGTDRNDAVRKLWYEASPVYQVSTPKARQLLDSTLRSELDQFLTRTPEGLLHIQYESGARPNSDGIRNYLNEKWQLMSFPFNRRDVRFNNVNSMLRTFLCNIAYHSHASDKDTISGMLFRLSGFSSMEIASSLRAWKFHTNRSSTILSIYLLENLHECDMSSIELLSYLATIFKERECSLRVIVTTEAGKDDKLLQSFRDFSSATYHKYLLGSMGESSNNAQSVDVEETETTPRLDCGSWLETVSLATSPVFDKTWQDSMQFEDLNSMVSQYLQKQRVKVLASINHCQSQGMDTGHLFKDILQKIPSDRHQWAKTLLAFIVVSLRPLQLEEFQLVSALARKDLWEGTKDVMRFFAGLITVQGTEVRLSHPLLQELLDPTVTPQEAGSWWNLESVQKANSTVASFCLSYVAIEDEFQPPRLWPTTQSFPYGTVYWPHHYMKSRGIDQDSNSALEQLVEKAFETTERTVHIVRQLCEISQSFDSIDPDSIRPLPAAAYFGLASLVEKIKDNHADDKLPALVEAVKKGHSGIACDLLDDLKDKLYLDDPAMEKLIDAALLSGDALLKTEVEKSIHWKRRDTEETTWVSMTLLKACWVGCEHLTKKLLDAGASLGFFFSESDHVGYGPLAVACMSNSAGTLTALIEHAKATNFEWSTSRYLVSNMIRWGTEETLELLYDSCMEVDEPDEDGWSQILLAASYGRYSLIDALLSQRPYNEYTVREKCSTTAILYAIWCGLGKTTAVLLKHNADIKSTDSDGNSLFGAVFSGNADIVEMVLKHGGIDINFAAEGGHAPLIEAILNAKHKDKDKIVRLLIDHKADPEVRDPANYKRTALQLAVLIDGYDMTEIIKLLIAAGADVHATDKNGATALILALDLDRPPEYVDILLKAGSDIYVVQPSSGFNCIHYARHRLDFVKLLVEHDPTVDFMTTYGADRRPLELAVAMNIPGMVEFMIKHSKKDTTALDFSLICASQLGLGDACRILVEAGANIDARDKSKTSALSWATIAASDSAIQALLEYRPDVRSVDDFGRKCLHWVTNITPAESVQRLINAGAEVDTRDNNGVTPLIEVIRMNNMAALKCLLKYPAVRLTINIIGDNTSAMHSACYIMNKEAIELLVEAQADVNLDGGNNMETPISWVCIRNGKNYDEERERMMRFLVEKGASVVRPRTYETSEFSYPVHLAVGTCSVPVIQLFLDHGARKQLYEPDWVGRHGIHRACYNTLETLQTLQAPTEAFAARDKFGRLPLHYAVLSGDLSMVKFVYEQMKKADSNLTISSADHDGWTPLHWTARATEVMGWIDEGRDLDSLNIIQYLVDEGVDVSARARVRPFGQEEAASIETSWFASDIAAYHAAEDVAKKLKELESQSNIKSTSIVPAPKKVGAEQGTGFCDGCLVRIYGVHLTCNSCNQLIWCFKCAGWRKEFPAHETGHEFEWAGTETDRAVEDPIKSAVVGDKSERTESVGAQEDKIEDANLSNQPPSHKNMNELKEGGSDSEISSESDIIIIEEESVTTRAGPMHETRNGLT